MRGKAESGSDVDGSLSRTGTGVLLAACGLKSGCEGKNVGTCMLSSVTVDDVVRVARTWPMRRDLWLGFVESGARAASYKACVFVVGAAVV